MAKTPVSRPGRIVLLVGLNIPSCVVEVFRTALCESYLLRRSSDDRHRSKRSRCTVCLSRARRPSRVNGVPLSEVVATNERSATNTEHSRMRLKIVWTIFGLPGTPCTSVFGRGESSGDAPADTRATASIKAFQMNFLFCGRVELPREKHNV